MINLEEFDSTEKPLQDKISDVIEGLELVFTPISGD
jgi:hypothetical protein